MPLAKPVFNIYCFASYTYHFYTEYFHLYWANECTSYIRKCLRNIIEKNG